MTIPLTFRAIFDFLSLFDWWESFWYGDDTNYYYWATYNTVFFFVTTYIPILMQIFSLIFGFMRNKKVKLLSRFDVTNTWNSR